MLGPMTDELVTLREVHDPVEAEMLVDLLAQEGIVATVPGNTHSAMLGGLAASAFRVPLRVRSSDAARATAILSALETYDEEVDEEGEDEGEDEEAEEADDEPAPRRRRAGLRPRENDPPPARKKTVAIAAALIMPMVILAFGGGHFYARSYPRGFALLACGWLCLFLGCSGQSWAWLGLPLVVLADIVGAVAVVDARSEEAR